MKYQNDGLTTLTSEQRQSSPDLRWVDAMTQLLDTKYRIPGTKIRFGADFLMGLVPGAGDLLSMGFSAVLIATMAKHGASAKLTAKMLSNVALDTLVGSIPILGNFFDLFYKANYRNLLLMREYYDEGKHRGSVWPIMIGILIVMLALFMATVFLLAIFFRWIFSVTTSL